MSMSVLGKHKSLSKGYVSIPPLKKDFLRDWGVDINFIKS